MFILTHLLSYFLSTKNNTKKHCVSPESVSED